jgi:hypothetical protein
MWARPRQDAEHRSIVGQDIGGERREAAGLGRGEQGVEQESAETAMLPGVRDDDGDLVAPSASPGS